MPRTQNATQDLQKSLNKKIVAEIKKLSRKIENQNEFESGVEKVLELLRNDQKSEEINKLYRNSQDLRSLMQTI